MKCPKCGSDVRPSQKYPGHYLCDSCRKRYPKSMVMHNTPDSDPIHPVSSLNSTPSVLQTSLPKKKQGVFLKILLLLLVIGIGIGAVIYFSKRIVQTDSDKTLVSEIYSVGDTADLNNVKISVLGYEESSGDQWTIPKDGNQFIFVHLEIVNHSEEEVTVSSMASFENYCDDYKLDYSPNAFTAFSTHTDKPQMDGSISPEDSLNGYLCLEVPLEWKTIEIHYANNIWSDQKVIFEITK